MSTLVVQAVILAAGRGSRLDPAGNNGPKCLTMLQGKPLLRWTLDALGACGIERTLLVGGWRHEALEGWASALIVNPDWATTNMVASLQLADDWLCQADTLMVYGDGAYGPGAISAALRPDAIAAALPSGAGEIVVPIDRLWHALWSRRFPDPLLDAETLKREGTRLMEIGRRPECLADIDGQFMGLVRWTPAGWRRAKGWLAAREASHGQAAQQALDMTGLLQGLLDAGIAVSCVEVNGGWVEVDSQNDRIAAEAGLLEPGCVHDFRA